ncbi:MAG TPA: MFS transporter [Cellulomonas sp.]
MSPRRPSLSPTRTRSSSPAPRGARTPRAGLRPRTVAHQRGPVDAGRVGPTAPVVPRSTARDALGVRNFRLYVTSQVLTNTFGWAARVSQDWLVLTLTGSAAWVGLTVTLQLLPVLLLGLVGGMIADRVDRRRLLMVTQSVFGLSALVIGLLALTGHVQAWHVLAGAFVGGVATAFDNPARQAFVHEVAGPAHLRQAISINSAVFQVGALVGPGVAGVLINLVGQGWTFELNAAACLVAVGLLVTMRPSELTAPPVVERARGQLREGLAHARRNPRILWATVLLGFVSVTGVNMATVLAAWADGVFDSDAGGYALLNSMLAVGALTGAVLAGRRTGGRLLNLVVLAAAIGTVQLLAATAPSRPVFVVALVGMGLCTILYLTSSNTLVQLTVAPHLRGRVMSLYILTGLGAQGISGTLIGWVCEHLGPRAGMVAAGTGPLLGALVVGLVLARRSDWDVRTALRTRAVAPTPVPVPTPIDAVA